MLKICQHIRPEAYFDKKPTETSDTFLSDIVEKLGRELTPEEQSALGVTSLEDVPVALPTDVFDDDVDIIERI